jgi:thiamine pyrophosphate-dependent acetolactate synthase large subunit-like protein
VKVHTAVAKSLRDNGVDTLFGVLGDANLRYITDYIDLEGTRYIGAVDERGAVMMAEGYARVGNRLGVVSITHGPAVTNALTSLTEAARSRTPIVVLTGDTPAMRGHLQHIDLPGLVAPTGALYQRVHNPSEVFDAVAIAARTALISRRPVLVDVPVDLLGADVERIGSPAPPSPAPAPSPGEEALDRALGMIASARRPLVLAGRGAVLAQARKELLLLADTLGAPVATTLLARDFFRGEPFNLGVLGTVAQPPAVEVLAESDCVITFGASLNRFTAGEGSAFVGKTVVHIDTDPAAFDTFTAVDARVLGDARIAATIMVEQLRAIDHRPSAFRSDDMARRIADFDPRASFTDGGATHLDVRSAMMRLDELLPPDRIVVTDVGRFVGAPWSFMHVQNPLDFAHSAAFGSIGLGTAMGVGAAAAHPDRLTAAVAGDGGAMMGIVEFSTAVRHRLPLMLVIVNDGGYGAEWSKLRALGIEPAHALIAWPDLADLGRALGGYGLTARTLADLEPVPYHVADAKLPLLIDLRVDAAVDIGLLA